VFSSDCPQLIQTLGVLGMAWAELLPGQLAGFELLYLRTKTAMKLRIGAAPAAISASVVAWPVTFAGGEAFAFTVDGTAVAGTFTAGSRTAEQTATVLNQAALGAGLQRLPFSVVAGQLKLTGAATGKQGSVAVTTALAAIGFGLGSAVGAGADLDVAGLVVLQFEPAAAPARIQISGQGYIEVLAAGSAVA
jgi:hypothetical protein